MRDRIVRAKLSRALEAIEEEGGRGWKRLTLRLVARIGAGLGLPFVVFQVFVRQFILVIEAFLRTWRRRMHRGYKRVPFDKRQL
ncbi:hypothetical protein D9M68_935410 [compost metagenome]